MVKWNNKSLKEANNRKVQNRDIRMPIMPSGVMWPWVGGLGGRWLWLWLVGVWWGGELATLLPHGYSRASLVPSVSCGSVMRRLAFIFLSMVACVAHKTYIYSIMYPNTFISHSITRLVHTMNPLGTCDADNYYQQSQAYLLFIFNTTYPKRWS